MKWDIVLLLLKKILINYYLQLNNNKGVMAELVKCIMIGLIRHT